MKTVALIATMLGAAALAGCADSDPDIGEPAGPPLSIEDALAAASDEPHVLSVRGNLLAQGGSARLCSALAESFPPQCGGASLVVEGLELEAVTGLVTQGDISWTDRPIELLGVVSDGTLTVSENAR